MAAPDHRHRPRHRGAGAARPRPGLPPTPAHRHTGLGPVIDLPDAAASKARALNDRRAVRDYLDLQALLTQPGWSPARLFAALRDNLRPVLTAEEFAADLAAAGQQDPEDYHAYGLTDTDIGRLAADFTRWAGDLRTPPIDNDHQ